MNLSDELGKLADLHQQGQLSDQEFTDAKQRLIAESRSDAGMASEAAAEPAPHLEEKSYRSSRWSAGNLFFPDVLTLASDGMLFRKGAMFGSSQEHISYNAVASFWVKNGIFLSDISASKPPVAVSQSF